MSEQHELDLDDGYLEGWADRWRYPNLLVELERQGADEAFDGGEQAAADAWLRDLAQPPRNLGEALDVLVRQGHLAAAGRLVQDIGLLEREGTDPVQAANTVAAAAAAEQHERQRNALALTARAEAAGVTVSHGPGSETLVSQVSEGERQWRKTIEQQLAAAGFDDEEFAALVRSALDSGEFAAAEQLVAAGPTEEIIGGPALVRIPRQWPYSEPLGTVLTWFDDGSLAPRDFHQRRPPADDLPGLALVAALRAAVSSLDATTARDLADALAGLVVDGPIRHRAEPVGGGGYRVRMYGLSDPRLPWLGLRDRVVLTIGPHAPEPAEEVGVWLPVVEPENGVRVNNTAIVTPRDLLRIVAPVSGRAGTSHYRRINLLRILCNTLEAGAVVSRNPGDLGNAAEMREAITWMFDMLGLRPRDPALPDVVLYDAARLPAAICAIVRELGARTQRPGDVTMGDLSELRRDPEAVGRIREAVTEPLGDDDNAFVVLAGLLMTQQDNERTVAPAEVTDELAEIAKSSENVDYVDVTDGIRRLNAVGLVRVLGPSAGTSGTVRFCGPGLAALLTDDGLLSETERRLQELYALAEDRKRAARIAVESHTSYSYRHLYDNYVFIQGQLAVELARPDLPMDDRQRIRVRLERVTHRLTTLRLAQDGRFDELAARDFDLTSTLEEFCRLHQYDGAPATTEVVLGPQVPQALPVRGIEELVQLALDDLVVNAHRAMERDGSEDRTIRITVTTRDRDVEQVVVLDVEDSGPGFGALPAPDDERERAGLQGGNGIANARVALSYCRGELEQVPQRSALGGAHVRVVLPLTP
jgi:hypothetical protein